MHSSRKHDGLSAGPDALGISDSSFTLLRDLIEQHLGVFYDNGKRDMLLDRLAQLTTTYGMQSFLDLYYALKYDDDAERYWRELMDQLSVPETFFWRQPEHFETLVTHVLPDHLAARGGAPLRIWSAACCTGEEPLSIAIALAEAGAFDAMRIDIIASDASPAMVERARRGLYGERSFRNLPQNLRDKYFTQTPQGARISEQLARRIDWRVINLMQPHEAAGVGRIDVAFCRNVLIYFSADGIRRVAAMLARQIRPGGRLFLGAAESLTRVTSAFVLTDLGKSLVYVNHGSELTPARDDRAPGAFSGAG